MKYELMYFNGVSVAYDNSQGIDFMGDYANVINTVNDGLAKALCAKSSHACFTRNSFLRYGESMKDRIVLASKVKAHRTLEENVDVFGLEEGTVRFWGNHYADQYAKLGALMHCPPLCDIHMYKKTKRQVKDLALHMVDVLSTLKRSRHEANCRFERLDNNAPSLRSKDNSKQSHVFHWHNTHWVCISCLTRVKHLGVGQSLSSCSGNSPISELLSDCKGHSLVLANVQGGIPIVWCRKCWCFASFSPKSLGCACQGDVACVASSNKFYLSRFLHPVSKLRIERPVFLARVL